MTETKGEDLPRLSYNLWFYTIYTCREVYGITFTTVDACHFFSQIQLTRVDVILYFSQIQFTVVDNAHFLDMSIKMNSKTGREKEKKLIGLKTNPLKGDIK